MSAPRFGASINEYTVTFYGRALGHQGGLSDSWTVYAETADAAVEKARELDPHADERHQVGVRYESGPWAPKPAQADGGSL